VDITIRRMRESDLDDADRVVRTAFGTFLGLADPSRTFGDADFARTRHRADPEASFTALADGRFVGSNFVTRWGSFGFFGPLSVEPALWDRGVARKLLDPMADFFDVSGVGARALFTFPQSTKHVGLYQRYGFWPRSLVAVCQRTAERARPAEAVRESAVPAVDRGRLVAEALAVLDEIHPGLDPRREIESVARQRLGDTLFLVEGSRAVGLAICHAGAGSEAGSGTTYVKLAAVRPGAERFDRLLDAIEGFALDRGAPRVVAGVNTGRVAAYRHLLGRGYRSFLQGVSMVSADAEAFSRPDDWVLDDWR
jgi:predicted N-acetyltransferase YhbS